MTQRVRTAMLETVGQLADQALQIMVQSGRLPAERAVEALQVTREVLHEMSAVANVVHEHEIGAMTSLVGAGIDQLIQPPPPPSLLNPTPPRNVNQPAANPMPFRPAPVTRHGVAAMQRFGDRGELAVQPGDEQHQGAQTFATAPAIDTANMPLLLGEGDAQRGYRNPATGQVFTPSAQVRAPKPLPEAVDAVLREQLAARGCQDQVTARVIITDAMNKNPRLALGQALDSFQAENPAYFPGAQMTGT